VETAAEPLGLIAADRPEPRCVPARYRRMTEVPLTPAPGDEAEPGTPGTGENICPGCNGTGLVGDRPCPTCEGSGKVIEGIGGG